MAPLRTLAALAFSVGAVSGFAPSTPSTLRNTVAPVRSETNLNVFNDAMAEWEAEYPQFAKWGWGPSVHAEKWNGRHAMFGWVLICATAYAKGHNLIPDADVPLDLKEWGTLATISGKNTITHERAIILIANVHAFMVGLAATICPAPFSDPLLLDPNQGAAYERAVNTKPYGVIPEMKTGLTEEAEIMNGRMAMMGLITVISTSFLTGKPILDVVNEWVGGLYY
mmetsp:Transcript_22133/g.31123  ORF Transcript_22133/g.31123 Transcript_22133/m.31123 type:complete len:225 (+) Transcript_22133:66-740(+)|eukprot:CAMPEP_0184868398 /NCGR_PEP_ID=MMETSP0580-20130426/30252_1 /TAXON_ID=1118495 /ORGANISM="Dactyliosolen fragilissimus" /LENGTH=224 /DNA_ID=CAMNT_0027369249 /DNA_START=26 /DNA_END=700 /DNA_ORIENTATION=-